MPLNLGTSTMGAPRRLQYTTHSSQDTSHGSKPLPHVNVVAVGLGPFLMVHTSISEQHNSSQQSLVADPSTDPSSSISSSSGGRSALPGVGSSKGQLPQATAGAKQSSLSISLSCALHVTSQQTVQPQDVTHQAGAPSGSPSATAAAYVDVRSLWCTLKDSLTLKLLARLHQSAGLPAPHGLLVLPSEVADCVLQLLPVSTARF